jgi:hypothetical protein
MEGPTFCRHVLQEFRNASHRKGIRDRPLVRVLTGVRENLAYVVNPEIAEAQNPEPLSGVGFPCDAVFHHDPGLADALDAAWHDSDRAQLLALWSKATPLHELADA